MTTMSRIAWIALGGALGGFVRVHLAAGAGLLHGVPDAPAVVLLAINLSGSLLAGIVRGRIARRQSDGSDGGTLDAFLLVGFCGGYTSYSSFIAASVGGAAWLVAATLLACPFAALLGMRLSGGYPARPAGNPR